MFSHLSTDQDEICCGVEAIDTSSLPFIRCSQSTVFGALNRKARAACTKSTCNTQEWENGLTNRVATQCKQCWHIVTDGRKKARAGHCCFEQCPEKCKGTVFSCFSKKHCHLHRGDWNFHLMNEKKKKPKRRLEDCKA